MKTLDQYSGMPQISDAFAGWLNTITLILITQLVSNNGFVSEVETPVTFEGVIQPLSPKSLILKPEGERAFEWLQIHCPSGSLTLQPKDKIICNGKRYKIMAQNDYNLDNYVEYHAIFDYQG